MSLRDIIFEDFESESVAKDQLDELLAHGWRHAGVHFYRYNFAFHRSTLTEVIPLRIDLEGYRPSKGQRRLLKRNRIFQTVVRPALVDQSKIELFQQHKRKFEENIPESIYDFLSKKPASIPCEGGEIAVYDRDRLVAASFFDIGATCLSAIYGMYDLDYRDHGLGIYTMLKEIELARSFGKSHYYHGYCYSCPSFYDYKKRFTGLQRYDWRGRWRPWPEPSPPTLG